MRTEKEILVQAQQEGRMSTLKAYLKLSGPGWLQSAITLGGGSLAGALFLGVIGGYDLLWVQLLAMILGVIMLCAISYVTLSIERSPFQAIRSELNPVLAWGWVIATLMANLVWALPQYSLAYAAITQNLMPETFAEAGESSKYLISGVIFVIVAGITLCYGKQHVGITIYETLLKIIVASIVLCFMGVVFKLSTSAEDFHFAMVLKGFIPDVSIIFNPAPAYAAVLEGITSSDARAFWSNEIVDAQRLRMVGATSAAVGINMTFLLPYSMLAKGWTREFRGLAVFDLSTGMIIPFILAVSCVVIASAYMFHGQTYEGLLDEQNGIVQVSDDSPGKGSWDKLMAKRMDHPQLGGVAVTDVEKKVAAMLIPRDNKNFATSLSGLTGNSNFSNLIFGIGVLAMALSTISLLMLISGFALSEMCSVPHGGPVHRIGILLGATGILWPMLWTGGSKAFLAIVTSSIGYTLLPIAFLTFFLMMNSKRLLGEHLPRGGKRVVWNTLMGIALAITGWAAIHTALGKTLFGFPIGKVGVVVFLVLVVMGQVHMAKKHA